MNEQNNLKRGDKVKFLFDKIQKEGEIWVIDRHGTLMSNDPSCDIFCKKENFLYKHIPFTDIIL